MWQPAIKQQHEGERKLHSAATYLDLQWSLNNPDDDRTWNQWREQTTEGQASAILHCMAAGGVPYVALVRSKQLATRQK